MAEQQRTTVQSQMIDLTTGRFHYLSWNAGRLELPGVLLLHGLTSSAWTWTRVGSALAARYRVYALDLRGHGESVKSEIGTYGFPQLAADAAAFLEAVKLQRSVLIGISWGGAIVLVLASGSGLQKPAPAFSQVILVDPALDVLSSSEEEVEVLAAISSINRPASEWRSEIAAGYPHMSEDEIESRIEAFRQVTPEALRSIYAQEGQMGDLLPLLAKIPAPTLLLRADAALGSALDDTTWQQAKQYLPAHSHSVEIAGATHTIHWSKFAEFIQQIYRFIEN